MYLRMNNIDYREVKYRCFIWFSYFFHFLSYFLIQPVLAVSHLRNCLPPFFQFYIEREASTILLARGCQWCSAGSVRSPHSPSFATTLALEQSMYGHWLKIALLFRWICCFKVQTSDRILCASLQKITSSVIFCTPKSLSILRKLHRVIQSNVDLCCLTNCALLYGTPCIAALARWLVQHGVLIIGSKL